ncbi:helix-turn-helix domain-containing protein [[Clostridium] innocuum]|uniref:helix-turn-helix domain-containing protein n=1 Tax=Clostridium innocuum TaxID=1522 RepID=UPI0021488259|nr:helix-turn-helix transcriptional regulator [[Clostridium] innocuum]MCR0274441.1 helix-turn-helix domain-containing protein [[Clostridium] innocuum]
MDTKLFAKKLLALLNFKDISIRTLAKEIGVSNTILNLYIKQLRNPSDKVIQKIADYFKIPVAYLKIDLEYDPYIMLDYLDSNIDDVLNSFRAVLNDSFFCNDAITSLIEKKSDNSYLNSLMKRMIILYLSVQYEHELDQQNLKIQKEAFDPKLLTDYSSNDYIRLFNLLGKLNQYGFKAMLREGEHLLEEQDKIYKSETIPVPMQVTIINRIEKELRFRLDLGEYEDYYSQFEPKEVDLQFPIDDISKMIKEIGIDLDEQKKKEIVKYLNSLFQYEYEKGYIK